MKSATFLLELSNFVASSREQGPKNGSPRGTAFLVLEPNVVGKKDVSKRVLGIKKKKIDLIALESDSLVLLPFGLIALSGRRTSKDSNIKR